ncbi:hypothetical protein [Lysobacter sp. Root690]|uniref:DUF6900 domain-containing protein n=1 Tax=Lysobacter sp. Root690 TaxID=1736588 RepID=UPI000A76FBAB|nr:hypothetical protein [Lysobacter sp. Root690]
MNRKTLTTIAQQYLDVSTLDAKDSDSAGLHSVSTSSLDSALTAAYLAGYAAAIRAAGGYQADALPTERRTMVGNTWLREGDATDWSDDPRAEAIVTLPIPEVALTAYRWLEHKACEVLIPTAIRQRRIA